MFWSKSSPPIGMASRRPTDIAVGFAGTKWNHYREENLSACGSIDIFSLPVADVLVAAAGGERARTDSGLSANHSPIGGRGADVPTDPSSGGKWTSANIGGICPAA